MARRRYDPLTTRATWAGVDLRAAALEVDELRAESRLFAVDHPSRRPDPAVASLAMKRQVAKRTGIPLPRYRVAVWRRSRWNLPEHAALYRWEPCRSWRADDLLGSGPWRVRVELRLAVSAFGPRTGTPGQLEYAARLGQRPRVPRGRCYFTALGEGAELEEATGQALVLLDESIENNWFAVELEPSPRILAANYDGFDELLRARLGHLTSTRNLGTREALAAHVRDAMHAHGVEPTSVEITTTAPGQVDVVATYRGAVDRLSIEGTIREVASDELPVGVEASVNVELDE